MFKIYTLGNGAPPVIANYLPKGDNGSLRLENNYCKLSLTCNHFTLWKKCDSTFMCTKIVDIETISVEYNIL